MAKRHPATPHLANVTGIATEEAQMRLMFALAWAVPYAASAIWEAAHKLAAAEAAALEQARFHDQLQSLELRPARILSDADLELFAAEHGHTAA